MRFSSLRRRCILFSLRHFWKDARFRLTSTNPNSKPAYFVARQLRQTKLLWTFTATPMSLWGHIIINPATPTLNCVERLETMKDNRTKCKLCQNLKRPGEFCKHVHCPLKPTGERVLLTGKKKNNLQDATKERKQWEEPKLTEIEMNFVSLAYALRNAA
jgi:hypothetical protein